MIKWGEITVINAPLELDGTPYQYGKSTPRRYIQSQKANEVFRRNPYDQTTCCCGSVMMNMADPGTPQREYMKHDGWPKNFKEYLANDYHKGITIVINDDKEQAVLRETAETVLDSFTLDSGDVIKFAYKVAK